MGSVLTEVNQVVCVICVYSSVLVVVGFRGIPVRSSNSLKITG